MPSTEPARAAAPPPLSSAGGPPPSQTGPFPPLGSRPPPRRTDGPTTQGEGPPPAPRSSQTAVLPPLGSQPPPRRIDGPLDLGAEPPSSDRTLAYSDEGAPEPMTERPPAAAAPEPGPSSERVGSRTTPLLPSHPPPVESGAGPDSEPQTHRSSVEQIPRAPAVPAMATRSSTDKVDASALRAAEHKLSRFQAKSEQLEAQLSASDERASVTEQELEQLREQHDALRGLMTVRAERIRELERLLDARDKALAEAEQALETARAEAQAERARADAAVVTTAPDDLRKLYGVGPKVEERLHNLGIRRFADIAAWTDEDIERIAPQLKVHAKRIRKDGWVESARELAGPDAESLEW